MLREVFEISLVISICLAFLERSGLRRGVLFVWLGAALALLLSALAATGLLLIGHDLGGRAEQLWEAGTMLAAALVLVWMIFWMRRHARLLRGELEQSIGQALGSGSLLGVTLVAFLGVLREGLETALLLAGAVNGSKPVTAAIGGASGALLAVVLGYLFYRGSKRLDLKRFFSLTSLLLLLFVGWLVTRALSALATARLLPAGWWPYPLAALLVLGLARRWRQGGRPRSQGQA